MSAPTDVPDDERRWLKDQVERYTELHDRYELFAERLKEVLRAARQRVAPLSVVQARAKAVPSFAEKALRQRTRHGDPVNEFTDLCGARVIVRTRSEVDAFSEFVKANFDIDVENSSDTSQRLKPTEFGYRSVHYIASFTPGKDYGVSIVPQLLGLKAEVQLRTFAEHAWADFGHDVSYKGAFELPDRWKRELAGIAAMVEAVDQSFARVEEGLETYASTYGAYMSEDRIGEEVDKLQTALAYDPGNASLAGRIARLWMSIEDWERAIDVLTPVVDDGNLGAVHPSVLRALGYSLCMLHRDTPAADAFLTGRRYLEGACLTPERTETSLWYPAAVDPDALASLADSHAWAGDEDRARELYAQAFELDPTHVHAFQSFLLYELRRAGTTSILAPLRPAVAGAIERSREQAAAGIDLPRVFFGMGVLHLLLQERPETDRYRDLKAFAKAVQSAPRAAVTMVSDWLEYLEKLSVVEEELEGLDWARRLLLLALATKFGETEAGEDAMSTLAKMRTGDVRGPVAMVVGSTDPDHQQDIERFRPLVMDGFQDFDGTIICGGTREGVSGFVGDVAEAYGDPPIHALAYRPEGLEPDETATPDPRYEVRPTAGSMFSPLQPLQGWIDAVTSPAAGSDTSIHPRDVRVLGMNGGNISAVEFRIALGLGAAVGILEGSGRESAKLLADESWAVSERLVPLPRDPATVRVFIGAGEKGLPWLIREEMAKKAHEEYERSAATKRTWEELEEVFRASSRAQADHTIEKLRIVGCEFHEVTDRQIELFEFTDQEVELLAELEHGRFNVERLSTGWTWGPVKDVERKISPTLVPWSELPEEERKKDRDAVRAIPGILAAAKYEIRRQPAKKG